MDDKKPTLNRFQRRYEKFFAQGLCVNCGAVREEEVKQMLKCVRCRDISRAASIRAKARKKETIEMDKLATLISQADEIKTRVNIHDEVVKRLTR